MIIIYDTTLRDGAQTFGISFSLHDKIRIAREIDRLKIDYIEGGWPGSNEGRCFFRDTEIGHRPRKIAAFGSTRRPRTKAKEDPFLQALVGRAPTPSPSSPRADFHVTSPGITLRENLELITDTVAYLKDRGFEVFSMPSIYDGYRANPDFALSAVLKPRRPRRHARPLRQTAALFPRDRCGHARGRKGGGNPSACISQRRRAGVANSITA